jgi:predicted DNA binding CopG/RHH family protein
MKLDVGSKRYPELRKSYDHISFAAPKGFRDKIKAAADAKGISLQRFIRNAIEEQIKKDGQ